MGHIHARGNLSLLQVLQRRGEVVDVAIPGHGRRESSGEGEEQRDEEKALHNAWQQSQRRLIVTGRRPRPRGPGPAYVAGEGERGKDGQEQPSGQWTQPACETQQEERVGQQAKPQSRAEAPALQVANDAAAEDELQQERTCAHRKYRYRQDCCEVLSSAEQRSGSGSPAEGAPERAGLSHRR